MAWGGPLLTLVATGCAVGEQEGATPNASDSISTEVAVLEAVFETARDTLDNVDSAAVWHGPAGEHWLLATAKETDVILVTDAATGTILRRIGSEGTGPGEFDRPNGIAVIDNLMWVVERDNARVQIFSLPDFLPLGTFGEELRTPYGIALLPQEGTEYLAFVSDNYEFEEDVIPADSLLSERVRRYRVSVGAGRVSALLEATFGDTSREGRLRVVESLAADPETGVLLIAEEEEGGSMIKVYSQEGSFSGRIIESSFFPNQAEGIVLYSCPNGEGYWVATDQGTVVNTFHIFHRTNLEHLGSFRGRTVLNTDGIALTQTGFPPFESGAFYAVHDDGSLAAFRWSDIAGALGLRSDCVS